MIALICIEPNPPKELQHLGRYESLDVRVTKEGESQVRVLSGAAGTPQVPHYLWWPTDLFEPAPPKLNEKEYRESVDLCDVAIAEVEKQVG